MCHLATYQVFLLAPALMPGCVCSAQPATSWSGGLGVLHFEDLRLGVLDSDDLGLSEDLRLGVLNSKDPELHNQSRIA